ncbi:amino acid permease, partial [Candidatus Woesearchaeota archaeon]|nr:amino acid permease [Candidatus Woesearchaeota archaeon]
MTRAPKQLSLFDATLLVMGGIIGVGIFFKPAGVAALLPEPGPYFGMWILGTLAALAGAMTFAELAGTLPRSGGWFVFIHKGFGPLAAFLFAWIVLLVIS